MRLGGYSEVARALTRRYHLDPPVKRQQIHAWNSRRTLNRAGQMFPSPVTDRARAGSKYRRLRFDVDAVIIWAQAGVPSDRGNGWREYTSGTGC